MLGQITGALGGSGPKYRGYKPQKGYLREYESLQRADVKKLQGPDAYKGAGLGYSSDIMQLQKGLSEGDRSAEKQRLYDAYAGSPYGTRGRAYLSAQQGVERGQREEGERIAAGITVADEAQRREDMRYRMGATGEAYGQGTDLYNAYAQNRYQADQARFQEKKNRYAAIGNLAGLALGGI